MENIDSLDLKIRAKAQSRLGQDVYKAFPTQKIFNEKMLVDLSELSTVDGKYSIEQLMGAIRNTCLSQSREQYYAKDAQDFIEKVEKLPAEDKI